MVLPTLSVREMLLVRQASRVLNGCSKLTAGPEFLLICTFYFGSVKFRGCLSDIAEYTR